MNEVLLGIVAVFACGFSAVLWWHGRGQGRRWAEENAALRVEKAKLGEQAAESGRQREEYKERWEGREQEIQRLRQAATTAREECASARAGLQAAEKARTDSCGRLAEREAQCEKQSARIAELETSLENARSRRQHEEEVKEDFSRRFELMAKKLFEENRRRFGEDSDKTLTPLLSPLKQQLGEFRARLDSLHNETTKERSELKAHIEYLQKNAAQISSDAQNLTQALKGDKKQQGDWGEILLENLLQDSGLRKDQDYEMQKSLTGEDGRLLRPDCLIRLPNGKHLIVDSKVSLVAYEGYVNHRDEEERQRAAKQHVAAVRRHIEGLGEKHYASARGIETPDFVFLFMPLEPAFFVAMEHDTGLFGYAYKRRVVLTTPTTLMAILRTVQHLWDIERRQRHANDIAEEGGRLHDKFAGFLDNMQNLGKKLEQAQGAYEDANKKLQDGRGNLLDGFRRLRDMGVQGKKSLPDKG